MKIPLYLSGNFGEIRSNHFHTGIDIKTQGAEGKAIYAIADGYISRIKVSPTGFGKALYINHINGFTSVYAHMQKFTASINKYTKEQQYLQKSFKVNLFPSLEMFPVKKGDLIGYSGNSGSSGGPHLHFEIRETKSEQPVNPLLFSLPIKDDVKPSIYGVMLYAMNEKSHVNKKNSENISLGGTHGNYILKDNKVPVVHGEIGISIHTIDRLTGVNNKCGIYNIKVYVDSVLTHHQNMEKLNFSTNRYINSHIDYYLKKRYKKSYQKCFIEPHNLLEIYPISKNKGVISFQDDNKHHVKIIVDDVYGNVSELNFNIQSTSLKYSQKPSSKIDHFDVKWDETFTHTFHPWVISIPPGALYRNQQIKISGEKKDNTIIQVGDRFTPIHKKITLEYTFSDNIPDRFYFAQINETGNKVGSFIGKKTFNKTYAFYPRSLGSFTIMQDTISPYIKPIRFQNNKEIANGRKLSFLVRDKETGISNYTLFIDGQWALLEYNPKKHNMYYVVDKQKIGAGKHTFKIEVSDAIGNKSEFSGTFNCL